MDREPKGSPPKKVIYLCDKKKERNKSFGCGEFCNHTTDIRHAVNFINLGDGIHFEERSERKWIPCSNPPKHHKDVIVRGIEAIGNVTVHKVMQWDVDTWRPTDYAPSIIWKEWSEI